MRPSRSPESSMENSFRDGSPDKIASQAMSREANRFSLGESNLFAAGSMNGFKPENSSLNLKFDFLKTENVTEKRQPISDEVGEAIKPGDQTKSGDSLLESLVSTDSKAGGLSNRDKVSFVSAAFCNPLFLVGMGAAMAVLDDLREAREARMEDALSGRIQGDHINSLRRQADSDRQEQAIKAKTETEEEKKKRLLLEATGLLGGMERTLAGGALPIGEGAIRESILKNGLRKQQQQKDMREKMREKLLSGLCKGWDEKATQRSVINWLKTSKLVKYKMKLESQIEKTRSTEGFAATSKLSARMEQVDKALKKLGA